jgi:peptide chain release factor 1
LLKVIKRIGGSEMAAETTPDRFASVHALLAEYDVLEKEMADPSIHADQGKARQLGKRYAALGPVIAGYRAWKSATEDLAAGKEMAADDADFALEIPGLEAKLQETETALEELLLPRDPNDDRDVILEIKAGAGGDESALFAGDLLRMYQRFAERQGWKTEIIDYADSEMGGYKEISMAVKSKGIAEPGKSPYAKLKFEGGVHRVQRVPETESQGRIHTSAAGVLILAEADEVDIEVRQQDLRIDVYRSSGPGGQSVNTTDSAVRITHIPTGVVVSCQNERSQIQNKATAMVVLQSKLLERRRQEEQAKINALKGDNSGSWGNQMRSYVLAPYQMVKDLRNNHETGNTSAVLNGEIDDFIEAGIRWRRSQAAQ